MSTGIGLTKDFEPISDPKEIENLIWEAGRTLAPALIWIPSEPELQHKSHCLGVEIDPKQMLFWVPNQFETKPWVNYWATQTEAFCLFNLSLTRANLFFKAKYLGHDARGLIFQMPATLFKVQRRKDVRLPLPEGSGWSARIGLGAPPPAKRSKPLEILDISAGGVAVLIPPDLQSVLVSGAEVDPLELHFPGKVIQTRGSVRHTQAALREGRHLGMRAGIQFLEMKASDSQWIASFVFEESRKIFSRLFKEK